jgi:hypothetical protein
MQLDAYNSNSSLLLNVMIFGHTGLIFNVTVLYLTGQFQYGLGGDGWDSSSNVSNQLPLPSAKSGGEALTPYRR